MVISFINFILYRELVLLIFCQERPTNNFSISIQSSRDIFSTSPTALFVNPQEVLLGFQGQRSALEFATVQSTTQHNITQHNITQPPVALSLLVYSEAFDPPESSLTAGFGVFESDDFSDLLNLDQLSDSQSNTEAPSPSPRDDNVANLHASSNIPPSTTTTVPDARHKFPCVYCHKSFPRKCQLKYVQAPFATFVIVMR